MIGLPCPACGHRHEGPGLAGICVGCPCEYRPAERDLKIEDVEYFRRQLWMLADADGLTADQRYAYGHALTMLNELLEAVQ